MKLLEVTEYDLCHRALQSKTLGRLSPFGPYQHAIRLLLVALDTANQAGLDGKKLSDLEIREVLDPAEGYPRFEVHANVTHRLVPPPQLKPHSTYSIKPNQIP